MEHKNWDEAIKNMQKVVAEKYKDMMSSLKRVVKNSDDTYWIFWCQVGELINQSEMPISRKKDCLELLMKRFSRGTYLCDEIASAVICKEYSIEHHRIQKEYCFAERLLDIGESWKDLIWNHRISRYRVVGSWMRAFECEIMPSINKMITEFEVHLKDKAVITEDDMKIRQEDYRSYRKAWKRIYNKWETICELMIFMQTDPEYLQKMRLVFYIGVRGSEM